MTGILEGIGLTAWLAEPAHLAEIADAGPGQLGRVVRVDKTRVSVQTSSTLERIENAVASPLIVGDWVLLGDESCHRLERSTELVRRAGHRRDERQPIAANFDLVLVVRGFDTNLSPRRLAAFLVIAWDSGATPLVVLSKSDVSTDATDAANAMSAELGGVETFAISTHTGAGLDALRQRIGQRTIVLLGDSGAGKSSLTNALVGREVLATTEVGRDAQGRHTTTHRELVALPNGGAIIDTPGIRDAAAFGERDGLRLAFPDVQELIDLCRFDDCRHVDTLGCAVEEALKSGELSGERFAIYSHEAAELMILQQRLEGKSRSASDRRRRH